MQLQSRVIDAIWVRDVDRSARSVWIGSGLIEILRENRAILFIGEQRVDPTNYREVLLPNIQFSIAEHERGAIAERTLRGRKASLDKGNRKSYNIFGYDGKFDEEGKRVLIVNQEEAKVIRHIFQQYKKGLSFKKIFLMFNGFPGKVFAKGIELFP